jgi:hypothetical protein
MNFCSWIDQRKTPDKSPIWTWGRFVTCRCFRVHGRLQTCPPEFCRARQRKAILQRIARPTEILGSEIEREPTDGREDPRMNSVRGLLNPWVRTAIRGQDQEVETKREVDWLQFNGPIHVVNHD